MSPTPATVIAGIVIPSTSPLFVAGVGIHVIAGLLCVAAGAVAMLSKKGRGRHSAFGTAYYWGLGVVCGSAAILASVRWAEDRPWLAIVRHVVPGGHVVLGRVAK